MHFDNRKVIIMSEYVVQLSNKSVTKSLMWWNLDSRIFLYNISLLGDDTMVVPFPVRICTQLYVAIINILK